MEKNNALPTWKDALRIAKELQEEYGLPIFAMTFKGECSCCAHPSGFNREAYLTRDVAWSGWADVDAYVVLWNSFNSNGEARFYHTETIVNCGKVKRRRVWDEFGTVAGGKNDGVQYVKYRLSESFTMGDLHDLLTKFVDGLNEAAGFEAYALVLPDDESECAQIVDA
jgi:hypothetical protein